MASNRRPVRRSLGGGGWRGQFRCRGSRRQSAVAQLSTLLFYLGFARQPLIAWLNQPCLAGQTQIQTLHFPLPCLLFHLTVERAGVRGNARNLWIANIIRAVTVVKSEWHWPSSTAGSRTVSERVPWV